MGNEFFYQLGGVAIILIGGTWGLKFFKNQTQKEKLSPVPDEKANTIDILENDFKVQLNQSKDIQFSLQEENVSLKNKVHHLEKQIVSLQNSLSSTETQKNDLENRVNQDKLTITKLKKESEKSQDSQQQLEFNNQKKIQELLAENQYLSDNFRHEVSKRTDLQQQFSIVEQAQKQFSKKEQQQQQAIQELEKKNKELDQAKIDIDISLGQEIEHLREEKKQLEQVLGQHIANEKTLQVEIAQLIASGIEKKESHQQTIAEINLLKPQIQVLETDKTRLQRKVESQTEQLIQENVRKEQAITEVDELKQQIVLLESDNKKLQQELDVSKNAIAQKANLITKTEPNISTKTQIPDTENQIIDKFELTKNEQLIDSQQIDTQETIINLIEETFEIVEVNLTEEPVEITEVIETLRLKSEPLSEKAETPVTDEPELAHHHPETHLFADKKFIIVGTLTQLNREQAKTLIQQAGGSVTSSPSSKTNYVLVGKSPGEKLKKAQKLGISPLTESQFLSLLNGDH